MGPQGYPPPPEILNDHIRTQIFTHRSFLPDEPDDPSPDNEMLEHLGDSVLSLVVTGLLREELPCVRVGPSTKIRALVVGNPTLASISLEYRLPEKLRVHPAQAITLQASVNIQDQGFDVVKSWLYPLFRPYIAAAYREIRVQHGLSREPPQHRGRNFRSGVTSSGRSSPAVGTTSSIGHLSLFNQHLQQHGKTIEWSFQDSVGQGTRTTPIWVVQALVDNECLGRGRGSTKKAAKNEAAKQGLQKMRVNVS
ncbi:ribonuclease III [Amylocystis lapponica]|nr:ribonuclease III [Amylocystis lapponica]